MIASLKIGSFQWLPSPLKAVNLLSDKKRRSFPQSHPWKLSVFQKIDSRIEKKRFNFKSFYPCESLVRAHRFESSYFLSNSSYNYREASTFRVKADFFRQSFGPLTSSYQTEHPPRGK